MSNVTPPQLSTPIITESKLGYMLTAVWKDWFQRLFAFLNYLGSSSSAAQALTANGQTISLGGNQIVRVAPTGAYTGVILGKGSQINYQVTVINESASADTITMAASGTSNIADGTSCVIAGLTQKTFYWDIGTSLWYHS